MLILHSRSSPFIVDGVTPPFAYAILLYIVLIASHRVAPHTDIIELLLLSPCDDNLSQFTALLSTTCGMLVWCR